MPLPGLQAPPSQIGGHARTVDGLEELPHPEARKEAATAGEIDAASAQYDKWIQSGDVTPNAAPAPEWNRIPTRLQELEKPSQHGAFDNQTLRQILGNDVAVKQSQKTTSTRAGRHSVCKVAWLEQADEKGLVRAARFQVEFMIRDSKKYERPWVGMARWRGADLKPYGKDGNFRQRNATGCTSPWPIPNYVFTMPIRGQQ